MQAIGRSKLALMAGVIVAGCTAGANGDAPFPTPVLEATPAELRGWLRVLAADSLEGRATATPGAARAARLIADAMRQMQLVPAGDSGFFQRVPLVRQGSQQTLALAPSTDRATVMDVNVVGVLPGSDSALKEQAVIVGAHFDHIGVGAPVAGDSIYNGADDDASGVVAVLAVARALTAGPPPRRTVIFLLTTGEEVGLLGTAWYIAHPVVPLTRTVADLQIEMIGRPDSLVGGVGAAWLTGYERSTVGDLIRREWIPIAPDPRPKQNLFERSDNIAFAREGIPAHTLSSFGLHADYHAPSDEVEQIDFAHMSRVVSAATRLVRLLADGPVPEWHPGGRP